MGTVFESDDRPDSAISVPDMVERWVARTPGHPAIVDGDGTVITYADLWQSAGEVARRLPIADGEVVGVSMTRGAAAVTAMLAVLRAGGVYCPTRPEDPPSRTRRLQDRVGIRFVLSEAEHGAIGIEDRGGRSQVLDCSGERPIYVMWTSGSTGEPKAVVIPHRGVVRLARDRTFMDLRPDDRVTFASNPMFDAATWEVWATLGNGATIVVIDQDDLVDAVRLRSCFERAGVTRAFLTTSLFDLLASRDPSMFGGLRTLGVGGESLRPRTIGAVLTSGSPPGELVNGYGPTECTTFATSHVVTLDDIGGTRIPIGTPLLDTMVAIVDDDGRIVPSGGEGELWIAGSGVALGYLGPDGLEQDRFVEVAFEDDVPRRWYRTGDLVRLDEHGRLDLLGRIDRQVKIRGYRIEPIEIEQAIASHSGVAEVAVITDRSTAIVRLCAFVVASAGVDADAVSLAEQIRTRLRTELPSYMIPARITVVDHLPLTANGKLDTTTLLTRPPVSGAVVGEVDPHRGDIDPIIAAAVEQARVVLAHPALEPDDDLWAAGLDSLSAIELASALSNILGQELHSTEFVRRPTVESIVSDGRRATAVDDVDVTVFSEESSADPIFAVVGSGTSPLALRHLAQHLRSDGRSLVVIEPGGPRSDRRTRRRIESLAERVISAIESRRPTGPLVIAGWSAGGVIATEVTARLEERGREVRLILFDTVFVGTEVAGSFVLSILNQVMQRVRSRLRTLSDRSTDTPDGPYGDENLQMLGLKLASTVTLYRYGTPAPLRGPVLHLCIPDSITERSVMAAIPGCTSIAVRGDHISMFDAFNAPALSREVNGWLATAESVDRSTIDGAQRRPTPL